MSKDSLKFFQSYIREMADIGGEMLPRTVSTKLGAKLGKLYNERFQLSGLESNIKQLYFALSAKPQVTRIDDSTIEVLVKHKSKFCPIGGNYKPERAEFVNKSICIPYTIGFLNEISNDLKFEIEIKKCITSNRTKFCHYVLKIKPKS